MQLADFMVIGLGYASDSQTGAFRPLEVCGHFSNLKSLKEIVFLLQ